MQRKFAPWLAAVAVGMSATPSLRAGTASAPSPSAALRDWERACRTAPSARLGELATRTRAALLDELPAASGDDLECYRQVLLADGLLLRELRRRSERMLERGRAERGYHEAAEALSRHLRTNPNQYVVDFQDRSRRVEIDPYPALDVQQAFTYALWVYLQAPALVPHTKLLSHAGVDPGKVTLLLNDNHPVALLQLSDGSQARFVDPVPLAVGRWIHLALTFHEDAGCAMYLDGAARALLAVPRWSDRRRIQSKPDQILHIGCLDRCFPGDIDDVRVYDRALAPAEIGRLSQGQELAEGLVGHWPLDEVVAGWTPNLVGGGQPGRVGARVQPDRPAAPPLRGGHSMGFSGKREAWSTRLAELEARVDAAELAVLRAAAAPAPIAPVSTREVAALLERLRRGDAKLIHYVELPAGSWAAFLVDPFANPSVRRFDLGPGAPIRDAVAHLQAAMTVEEGDVASAPPAAHDRAELRAAARHVAGLLWDPLAPALGMHGEVWVRLEPALERVPFAALVASNGRALVEDFAIAAVGPVAECGARGQQRDSPPTRPAVLFANPAFNHYPAQRAQAAKEPMAPRAPGRRRGEARPDCVLLGSYLQGSGEELHAIAGLIRENGRREVRTFEWGDAYETSLKAVAPDAGILHLATHAYRLDPDCLPAVPASAWELVGIRLSGANRLLPDDAEQPDDGFVSAGELARVDLRGCELAVFSGCATAQAAGQAGGDALGLASAVWAAGGAASLVTLWDIADAETSPSMVRFHAALLSGASLAQALRASQLEALRAAQAHGGATHPRTWASFALRGL